MSMKRWRFHREENCFEIVKYSKIRGEWKHHSWKFHTFRLKGQNGHTCAHLFQAKEEEKNVLKHVGSASVPDYLRKDMEAYEDKVFYKHEDGMVLIKAPIDIKEKDSGELIAEIQEDEINLFTECGQLNTNAIDEEWAQENGIATSNE